MGTYSLGIQSVAAAAGAPYATLHTGAGRIRISEIEIFVNAATASSVGLARPTNSPVATTSTLGQAQDPADVASLVNLDTAWSTAPTVSLFHRRVTIPAVIGNGIIWTFPDPRPFYVPANSYIVLWNFGASTGSILNTTVVWDE